MYRLKILLGRIFWTYKTAPCLKRLSILTLSSLLVIAMLLLPPFSRAIILLFSGNGSVYDNMTILLNKDPLKIHIIDVGQGDASLIQFEGCNMLIDCGPADSGIQLVDYLSALGIQRLDLLILTHPHEDHTGAVLTLLESKSLLHSLVLKFSRVLLR